MNYIVKDYDGYNIIVLLNCSDIVKALTDALLIHSIHLSVNVTPVDEGKYGVYDVTYTMKDDHSTMSDTYIVESIDTYECK